jgi:hypothetical protein
MFQTDIIGHTQHIILPSSPPLSSFFVDPMHIIMHMQRTAGLIIILDPAQAVLSALSLF